MSLDLREARSRLAYINQHREVTLGLLAGAAALCRWILAIPVPPAIVVVLTGWFFCSIAFVWICKRIQDERRLDRFEFGYFVLEVVILTLLAHFSGGAEWIAVMFYSVTIIYANVLLPANRGRWVTLLATVSFSVLVGLEYSGALPHRLLFASGQAFNRGYFVLATACVGAVIGFSLIGYTSSQFSRMVTGKTEALERANRELKLTSSELRLHKNNLEQLVSDRTADLERANADLDRANRELKHANELKSNFLSSVSHELRTPLTSIKSFSEILLNYPDEDLVTRTEFLQIIKSESERLTRLINNVLDLAKIEAGRMEFNLQPVQISELIHNAVEVIRPLCDEKKLELIEAVDADLPMALADPDRVIQVITNLLGNALKFTTEGFIRIGAIHRDSQVVIYVSDSGPGIPGSDLEIIFDKFHQRGDALIGKPQGTGLGLAICREIMQYHNGRIWAESTEGHGATFYCSFQALPKALTQPIAAGAGHVST